MSNATSPLRRRHLIAAGAVAAALLGLAGPSLDTSASSSAAAVPASIVPVAPFRLLDTRSGIGVGGATAPVPGGGTITLQVAGVDVIPADATGVVLNLTATQATSAGYVTATPTGDDRAETSVVNLTPGQDLPNMITAALGTSGRIDLYNSAGSVHLIADVAGYLVPATTGGSGPAGPAGPQGPAGPAGSQGAPGLAGVHVVHEQYTMRPPAVWFNGGVECPTGEIALGGGAQTFNKDIQFIGSTPWDDDGDGRYTGWFANGTTAQTGHAVTADSLINVFVVCARAAP